jgi:hypothetical protein
MGRFGYQHEGRGHAGRFQGPRAFALQISTVAFARHQDGAEECRTGAKKPEHFLPFEAAARLSAAAVPV